jgi:hypothetical protein
MASSSTRPGGCLAAALLVASSVAAGDAVPVTRTFSTSLPISFEANHGQADAAVKFLARLAQYRLFLTSAEAVLVASDSTPIRMRVVGMRHDPTVDGDYGTDRQLEHDLLVAPGADPAQSEWQFSGMTSLAVGASGDLDLVVSPSVTFTLKRPRIYQMVGGAPREIQGGCRRVGPDGIRLEEPRGFTIAGTRDA